MNLSLRLLRVETCDEPFRYFLSTEALDPCVTNHILSWFETNAPWKLVVADFYEQFEFSLRDVGIPTGLSFLRDTSFLGAIRRRVGDLFGVNLREGVNITAHKLVPGQRIRLHNDFIPGAETHRLLIQFNRGWNDENGGFLLFFNSANPADIHKIFRLVHNSAVGFAITATSYHAVSTLHAGERFTLVYSFYEK